jgi:hypothetical protein
LLAAGRVTICDEQRDTEGEQDVVVGVLAPVCAEHLIAGRRRPDSEGAALLKQRLGEWVAAGDLQAAGAEQALDQPDQMNLRDVDLAAANGDGPATPDGAGREGKDRPAGAVERLEFAGLCQATKRYAAAARLYADAFAADPKLVEEMRAGRRYNAACAAALAAAGLGTDAAKLDDKDRARLREQALGWLRADLARWEKQAVSGTPQARVAVQKTLHRWQQDADLAGVRDAAALAKLPEAERAEWQKLWAEVAALLKKSEAGGKN